MSEFEEADDPAKNPEPKSEPFFRAKRVPLWLHVADTQRVLAGAIVAVTLTLYAYLVVAVVFGWIDQDRFVAVIAALAPLQALAAATVGFFFGSREKG
ncbi:hypothetical protein ACIGEP_16630 [Microbacterium sp. NPDC077663]|uniref:hypothetical protein n=1 Tax=Microbacterium sp. NPDC077663 TaxID=3364189 RepID=UPI0037CC3512